MAIPYAKSFHHPFRNPDLSDGWGSMIGRSHPHRGLDYAQATGTPIPAIATGQVVVKKWSDVLGNIVVIKHRRLGKPTVYSGYCHLDKPASVNVGDIVKQGQHIGVVGEKGSAAQGPHLHLTTSHYQTGVQGPAATFNPYKFINNN